MQKRIDDFGVEDKELRIKLGKQFKEHNLQILENVGKSPKFIVTPFGLDYDSVSFYRCDSFEELMAFYYGAFTEKWFAEKNKRTREAAEKRSCSEIPDY